MTGSYRYRAARQENRHGSPLLGLTGLWRFYKKAVGVACWNVRFQVFRVVIFDPLSNVEFLKVQTHSSRSALKLARTKR